MEINDTVEITDIFKTCDLKLISNIIDVFIEHDYDKLFFRQDFSELSVYKTKYVNDEPYGED